jgi:hypothetical protein
MNTGFNQNQSTNLRTNKDWQTGMPLTGKRCWSVFRYLNKKVDTDALSLPNPISFNILVENMLPKQGLYREIGRRDLRKYLELPYRSRESIRINNSQPVESELSSFLLHLAL